jgi:hypothetical protein
MDDIFAEMKAEASRQMAVHQSKASSSKSKHSKKEDSVEALMAKAGAKDAVKKKKEKKEKKADNEKLSSAAKAAMAILKPKQQRSVVSSFSANVSGAASVAGGTATVERVETDSKTVMTKIARDVNSLADESQAVRRSAIEAINRTLFTEHRLSVEDYGEVFSDICKPIFKRYADPVEKIRELAFTITMNFFDAASDFTLVLGYFIPALMARVPAGMAYDEEMKVFVTDLEAHEEYRRGKAVDRADKASLNVATMVEPSEELRRMGCQVLHMVTVKLCQTLDAASILHPYYHEIVIFIARQLRDAYAEVRVLACDMLTVLMEVDEFNGGNKYFAVALCRALYPVMRHRLARVRVAALRALTVSMASPDRAKLKGSGTEALPDMVGFREENVLPVAAFYKADVQVNYLAEVVADSNHAVRLAVAQMLHVFMTIMGDRYDHQTRLLPYLLDLLTDPNEEVAQNALTTLQMCGKQYEEEHGDEIIERRQYGVDGDRRINLEDPLPAPFTVSGRPRLGVRLFVRGQIKRFLFALINEVTNWIGATRLKSANLLKMVVVLVEEHLTMEAHVILPAYIKALGFARSDDDKELGAVLTEIFTLTGRYVVPEVYVHYILPRLTGDPKVVQFGVDAKAREEVLSVLSSLLQGSTAKEIAPHFGAIVAALTDPFVIDTTSHRTHEAAAGLLLVLLQRMVGRGKTAVEAHYLATGRLTSLRGTVVSSFKWLLQGLCDHAESTRTHIALAADGSGSLGAGSSSSSPSSSTGLVPTLAECLVLLSQLDRDSADADAAASASACGDSKSVSVTLGCLEKMMSLHGRNLVTGITRGSEEMATEPYCHGDDFELEQQQQRQLLVLASSPFFIVQADPSLLDTCLAFAVELASGKCGGDVDAPTEHNLVTFQFLSDFVVTLLAPLTHLEHSEGVVASAGGGRGKLSSVHTAVMGAAGAEKALFGRCLSSAQVAVAREVVQPKLLVLIQLFVAHSRWGLRGFRSSQGSTSALSTHMLSLVELLVPALGEEEEQAADEGILPASTILDQGSLQSLLAALLCICTPRGTLLLRAPSVHRSRAVAVAVQLLRVVLAAYWQSVPYAQRKALPFSAPSAADATREGMRAALAPAVGCFLLLLDDPIAVVRDDASEGLALVAAFVQADSNNSEANTSADVGAVIDGMTRIQVTEGSDSEDDEDDEGAITGAAAAGVARKTVADPAPTTLPAATLTNVLACALRALASPVSGSASEEGGAGTSPLANAVRTLCVLAPAPVLSTLQRLEPAGNADESGGGVLLGEVLVPLLPALTQRQKTYKDVLPPLRELHKELCDHCELLLSLPM